MEGNVCLRMTMMKNKKMITAGNIISRRERRSKEFENNVAVITFLVLSSSPSSSSAAQNALVVQNLRNYDEYYLYRKDELNSLPLSTQFLSTLQRVQEEYNGSFLFSSSVQPSIQPPTQSFIPEQWTL